MWQEPFPDIRLISEAQLPIRTHPTWPVHLLQFCLLKKYFFIQLITHLSLETFKPNAHHMSGFIHSQWVLWVCLPLPFSITAVCCLLSVQKVQLLLPNWMKTTLHSNSLQHAFNDSDSSQQEPPSLQPQQCSLDRGKPVVQMPGSLKVGSWNSTAPAVESHH